MAKEIHEQPEVVGHTLARYVDMATERVAMPVKLPFDFKDIQRISIVACGTASYAGYIAKYWFERFGRAAGRNRCRLGIPLPRGAAAQGRSCDLHFAVRRDRRYAGGAALCEGAGRAHALRRQRADLDDRARKRDRAADAGRPGNRRRLDQGLHLPADGAGRARGRRRQGARRIVRCRRSQARAWPRRNSAADGGGAGHRSRRSRSSRATSPNPRTCSISAAAPAIRWRWKAR